MVARCRSTSTLPPGAVSGFFEARGIPLVRISHPAYGSISTNDPGPEGMEMFENSVLDSRKIRALVFIVELINSEASKPVGQSIVVRIQLEDVDFRFGAKQTESATGEFAELLAQQVALLALEKDFPQGMEPSLSAQQIDCIPSELENRLPDFCVNENEAWLVDCRPSEGELPYEGSAACKAASLG